MLEFTLVLIVGAFTGWGIWRLIGSIRPTHHDVESQIQEARKTRLYEPPAWVVKDKAEAEVNKAEAIKSQDMVDRMKLDEYNWADEEWRQN